MQTIIDEPKYPHSIRCSTDGSVAGTHFYNDHTGERFVPADVSVQQEGMSDVRIRFPATYGIGSFVMSTDDTLIVNGVNS